MCKRVLRTMAEFHYVILITLCLSQYFQRILVDSKEEEEDKNSILNALKLEVAEELKKLFALLINTVYKIDVTRIFKLAKEEIAHHFDDSSDFEECSLIAYEDLDALIEQIKIYVANCVATCIAKGTMSISEVMDEAEQVVLTTIVSTLKDFSVKIVKCYQKSRADDIWVSTCLDFKERMKMTKAKDEATFRAAKISKLILQVVENFGIYLKKVKVDALKNIEHVIDELKHCMKYK